MKIMNHYRVEITLKCGLLSRSALGLEYTEKQIDILAENEHRYCLNNKSFTTVDKNGKDSRINIVIRKSHIYSCVNDNVFGTQIIYYLYTDKIKRKKTIKKEIQKYIDDKFSCFMNVDLSDLDK